LTGTTRIFKEERLVKKDYHVYIKLDTGTSRRGFYTGKIESMDTGTSRRGFCTGKIESIYLPFVN
jgi:alanine racemase